MIQDADVGYEIFAETIYLDDTYYPRFILVQGGKTIEDIYWHFACDDKKTAQMMANSYFDEVLKIFSDRYGLHDRKDH